MWAAWRPVGWASNPGHATVVDGLENDLEVGEAVPVFDAISSNVTQIMTYVRSTGMWCRAVQSSSIEDVPCRYLREIAALSTAVREVCEDAQSPEPEQVLLQCARSDQICV